MYNCETTYKEIDDETYKTELSKYEKELRSGILMYRENDIQDCLRNFKKNRGNI